MKEEDLTLGAGKKHEPEQYHKGSAQAGEAISNMIECYRMDDGIPTGKDIMFRVMVQSYNPEIANFIANEISTALKKCGEKTHKKCNAWVDILKAEATEDDMKPEVGGMQDEKPDDSSPRPSL